MSARYHDKVVANAVIGTTESEAWAVGKRDGVDVVTSDPVYHNNSKYYASLAEQHESRALTAETNAKASETSAAESSSNATIQATAAAASAETATDKANDAATSASNAAESATASANSASSSSTSAQDSASSAASSANYASDAAESAAAALASQQAAETSETNAAAHETNANASSVAASKSETAAKTSETNAKSSETAAKTSETNASASESIAVSKASEALASASAAKISETNANTYYEKTKTLADSITGALKPMGTVTFEDLPPLVDVSEGCMYNISNQFVTTSEFKEGAGNIVPVGSNVYKTSDGYWDILAGTPVAGVKGESESSYRTGNVNITKENIGLSNVDNTSDNEKSVLSASKLSTARKIGNASFDGTKDITLKETGALDPIGDEFNSSLTYAVGDFCIYNNTLYKCTTAIDTAGEWDESKWEATTVAAELSLGSDNSVTLTRAEYDALSDEEKDSNTTYYISDEGAESNAFSVPFTSDKYTATNTGDALIEVKNDIAKVNSNLSKYNRDTDSYDIYEDGVLVGSLPCGFQKIVLYNAGVTPSGVTIHNNGNGVTINSDNIQLKGGNPSYGGITSGHAMFTKLIKWDSKSKISVECNISVAVADGKFYIGLATSDAADITKFSHSKYFSNSSTGLTTGAKTLVMDVSGITGNFYVCVGISTNDFDYFNDDALVATVSKVTVE